MHDAKKGCKGMHTSEEAFESEAQAISILKQWALSSERDELEVGLLSDCLAARKDGTDFVPVPNYIWGLTSNDVVWELRGVRVMAWRSINISLSPTRWCGARLDLCLMT